MLSQYFTHSAWKEAVEDSRKVKRNLTRNDCTAGERISRISGLAGAGRRMFNHATNSIRAARSRAWVGALFIDAGKITRAFRIDRTFGPAVRSSTNIVGQARASRHVSDSSAL